ncbi:hypothetical protein T01_4411 [Trichinella spiralis]|uniref:Uncharacterized protein n=1 Tax=Trichinella spiralis TaxID=6334 RepID=A0A0V1C178_TRISP|nr:hypothetical protein T01_4411 [Trichinella spiralis]
MEMQRRIPKTAWNCVELKFSLNKNDDAKCENFNSTIPFTVGQNIADVNNSQQKQAATVGLVYQKIYVQSTIKNLHENSISHKTHGKILEMGKALQLAKNLTELLHFQSYLLLEIVRVVSVHKPADQPTVEYEQADVSTASCDER